MKIKNTTIGLMLNKIDIFRYQFDIECRQHKIFASQFFAVAALIENEGITMSALANKLDVSRPSITKTVSLLNKNQLVEIKSSPTDSRASQIYLTAKARQLYPQILEIWERMENEFLIDFAETEKILLRHLVEKFKI